MLAELPDLTLLTPILDAAVDVDDAIGGNVQFYDRRSADLRIVAQRGFREPFLEYFKSVSAGDGSACAQALADRRRILIRDTETDPAFVPHRRVAEEAGFRSVISTPLICGTGTLVGVLSTHFRTPHSPSAKALERLDALAQLAAQVVEGVRLAESLDLPSGRRRSSERELPPEMLRAAAAARRQVALLGRRGASPPLVDDAIRQFGRLLPGLRRLGRDAPSQ